jgi:DNA-binding IclR family transcriptional regulator
VNSVARAIAVLDALAGMQDGAGVNELARLIGVNASTASRLLATLERGRLVERTPGGPYRLGMGLVALGDRVLERLDLRELARPVLQRLVADTGETATLSLPGAEAAVTIDLVPSEASVVSLAQLGRPSVAHATAVGKVMLAFGPAPQHAREESDLTAYTEHTITDRRALARELETVRSRGFAEAVREREPDLVAIAAPVFGRNGELAGIVGVQGPAARMPASRRRALRAALLRAAEDLGQALGASEP